MSPPDTPADERLAALPRLPRDEDGPVFGEPWQAEAFALAVRLSAQGHFTWTEWAAALAHELRTDEFRTDGLNAPARVAVADHGSRYYRCWLAALEGLVVEKRLTDRPALLARKEAWAEAYRRTPHGNPVEL